MKWGGVDPFSQSGTLDERSLPSTSRKITSRFCFVFRSPGIHAWDANRACAGVPISPIRRRRRRIGEIGTGIWAAVNPGINAWATEIGKLFSRGAQSGLNRLRLSPVAAILRCDQNDLMYGL